MAKIIEKQEEKRKDKTTTSYWYSSGMAVASIYHPKEKEKKTNSESQ